MICPVRPAFCSARGPLKGRPPAVQQVEDGLLPPAPQLRRLCSLVPISPSAALRQKEPSQRSARPARSLSVGIAFRDPRMATGPPFWVLDAMPARPAYAILAEIAWR